MMPAQMHRKHIDNWTDPPEETEKQPELVVLDINDARALVSLLSTHSRFIYSCRCYRFLDACDGGTVTFPVHAHMPGAVDASQPHVSPPCMGCAD